MMLAVVVTFALLFSAWVFVLVVYYGCKLVSSLLQLRKPNPPVFHRLSIKDVGSFWNWLFAEWDFRSGWAGPYYIIREHGFRVFGLEFQRFYSTCSGCGEGRNEPCICKEIGVIQAAR